MSQHDEHLDTHVNKYESIFTRLKDYFTQKPEDHEYQEQGGDSRVPLAERKGDPMREANAYAIAHGEEPPYTEEEIRVHNPHKDADKDLGARDANDAAVTPDAVVVDDSAKGSSDTF